MIETRAREQQTGQEKLPPQDVNYVFFKLDPLWRLPDEERGRGRRGFFETVERHGGEMLLRSCSLMGLRSDAKWLQYLSFAMAVPPPRCAGRYLRTPKAASRWAISPKAVSERASGIIVTFANLHFKVAYRCLLTACQVRRVGCDVVHSGDPRLAPVP